MCFLFSTQEAPLSFSRPLPSNTLRTLGQKHRNSTSDTFHLRCDCFFFALTGPYSMLKIFGACGLGWRHCDNSRWQQRATDRPMTSEGNLAWGILERQNSLMYHIAWCILGAALTAVRTQERSIWLESKVMAVKIDGTTKVISSSLRLVLILAGSVFYCTVTFQNSTSVYKYCILSTKLPTIVLKCTL